MIGLLSKFNSSEVFTKNIRVNMISEKPYKKNKFPAVIDICHKPGVE
jgi:hypothetical protein